MSLPRYNYVAFTLPLPMASKRGFTLVELLVALGIISILSVTVLVTVNPAELLKQSRDTNRISDLSSIQTAMQLYVNDVTPTQLGTSSIAFLSIPDATATTTAGTNCSALGFQGGGFHCVSATSSHLVNGTGWMPINLTKVGSGAPLTSLPTDPINTSSSGLFYTYTNDGTKWEACAMPESNKSKAKSPQFTAGTSANLTGCSSLVTLALTAINVTPASLSLLTGTTSQLTAAIVDQYGSPFAASTTWQTSSSSVATVNSSGLVTAINPGTATITAVSGAIVSNGVLVTVMNPTPVLTSLSPTSTIAGGSQFTMTLNGTNFISSSIVNFNGSPRTTTFVSPTQLTAIIPALDIASAGTGTASITVINPSGGTSNALNLTITVLVTQTSDTDFSAGTFTSSTISGTGTGASVVLGTSTIGAVTNYPSSGGLGIANPKAIAFDNTNMWVANYNYNGSNGSVSKVNVTSGVVISDLAITGWHPWGIAIDSSNNAWVTNAGGNTVTKISPAGTILGTYSVGQNPEHIAFDGTNMWTANYLDNTVTKMSLAGSIVGTYSAGNGPFGIAFDGTNMWVTNRGGSNNTVTEISPAGTILRTITVGLDPERIAFDGTNMWTANYSDNTVTKISPAGTILGTYGPTGPYPLSIAFDGTNMWTANSGDNTVTRISSSGSLWTTTSKTGLGLYDIAFDGMNMWTANFGDNNATKVLVGDSVLSGAFTSAAINIGSAHLSGMFSWTGSGGSSTTITMQARSANNSSMTGASAWGSCAIASGALFSTDSCINIGDSYIQYRAALTRPAVTISPSTLLPSSNPFQTPSLDSVTITN